MQKRKDFSSIVVLSAIAIALYISYMAFDAILPFALAFIIAFFAHPISKKLSKNIAKTPAALLVVLMIFLSIMLIVLMFAPIVGKQSIVILERFNENKAFLIRSSNEALSSLASIDPEISLKIQHVIENFSIEIVSFVMSILYDVVNSGKAIVNFATNMLIVPIVLFYFLRDWDAIAKAMMKLVPKSFSADVKELCRDLNHTLSGYVSGQFLVCMLMATYYGSMLWAVGLDLGLLMGILSGLLTIIPYIGAIFSCILSLIIAFLQFGISNVLIMIIAIYVIGQLMEGYYIVPKFVGDKINLHPVWIMLGLILGGVLLGVFGLILALPITAISAVFVRFAIRKYVASDFYKKV